MFTPLSRCRQSALRFPSPSPSLLAVVACVLLRHGMWCHFEPHRSGADLWKGMLQEDLLSN